ncbi:MAG: phytanoyl-CoA dioxygenase family protein [Bacteroidota bacterium]
MKNANWSDKSELLLGPQEASKFTGFCHQELMSFISSGLLKSYSEQALLFNKSDLAALIEINRKRIKKNVESQLSDSDVAQFWDEGFLLLKDQLNDELLEILSSVVDNLILQTKIQNGSIIREADKKIKDDILERILNIQDYSTVFRDFYKNPLFGKIGNSFFEDDYICYNMSLVVKVPNEGFEMVMHRDPTWTTRLLPSPVIAMGIYLDNSDSHNGGVSFFPKTHKIGEGGNLLAAITRSKVENRPKCTPVVKRGDILIHNLGVIHGSLANKSQLTRRTLYFSLMAKKEAHLSNRKVIC